MIVPETLGGNVEGVGRKQLDAVGIFRLQRNDRICFNIEDETMVKKLVEHEEADVLNKGRREKATSDQ